jgi:thiol-disulfide isomerase/thioredoxin
MTGRWIATWVAAGGLFLLTLGLLDARPQRASRPPAAEGGAAAARPEDSIAGLAMLLGLETPDEPVPAVDFELPALDGRTARLSDLKGRVVLLNFWATWCPPCRAEMPAMDRLYRDLEPKGFTILAVDYKEPVDAVRTYITELGLSFPILLDTAGDVGDSLYPTTALPTTYVIDRRGQVVARKIGFVQWDGAPARALIETLLAQPGAPS